MLYLKDILYKVKLVSTSGSMDVAVKGITMDSRKVKNGFAFVAVKGTHTDGHNFILRAIEAGAKAIICEVLPDETLQDVTYVKVSNSAIALGQMASNFYGNPSEKLHLVAVTGTNGKTTVASLLHQLFRGLGYNAGLLSTVVNKINENEIPSVLTTPDAVELNRLLAEMLKKGCTHAFMEASSHAIVQERMAGLRLSGAVFTNISHDHLDYHETFDNYIKAKKKLFDELPASAFALVNADDRRAGVMLQNCRANHNSFGINHPADFKGKIVSNTFQGLEMEIENRQVWFRLIGEFNASNLLAVYSVAVLLGEEEEEVLTRLSEANPAPGRFQQVPNTAGLTAIVDYAHTPDALENVLDTINGFRSGREQLITVIGCGGNRDATKRPIMAKVAVRLSDRVILTSDNPRDEDPENILAQMNKGVSAAMKRKVLTITDRKEAIKAACALAMSGDIILVAGKGHETYQEIKGERFPFDDRKILSETIKLIHGRE